MGYHYRARYEFILFFEKGKRRLNNLGIPDVIEAPRVHGGYPTEKPVQVSEVLVQQSSDVGEVVADPFMGSGSVGVAAVQLGRHFMGNDISPNSVAAVRTRLLEARANEVIGRDGPVSAKTVSGQSGTLELFRDALPNPELKMAGGTFPHRS
ncbi:MAG: site-specific DNA-methyltransferase [Polyangiaceae bacterium]